MKRDEGKAQKLSKAPDWQPLFLLKIKIKKNSGCPIMRSSRTFIRLSGPISELQKCALINVYENTIAYWEESEKSEV